MAALPPVTASQYDTWPENRCATLEIVAGEVVRCPTPPKRHQRLTRLLANALDTAAGPSWTAGTAFDIRLQDDPLTNLRPDVTVYRASTIDVTPTRPPDVLLVAELVAPGTESTDRTVKPALYAAAGIPFYWRIEQPIPTVHTYALVPATGRYRAAEAFTGVIRATEPFPVEVDLGRL